MTTRDNGDDERTADREAIIAHIDAIFRAYQRKDLETIRRTHTSDWHGFQIPSRAIVHGIEEYMATAKQVAESVAHLESWEFLEREIEFHGDVAMVWYVARETVRDPDGATRRVLLRSIDVYRKDGGAWNQCASHIVAMPECGAS